MKVAHLKKVLASTVIAAGLLSGVAHADTPNFTGFYLGANGGYGMGSGKLNTGAFGNNDVRFNLDADHGVKGFRGGLHAGYGYQFENKFYLGLEVSGDYSNTEGKITEDNTTGGLSSYLAKARRKDAFGAALHLGGLLGHVLTYVKLGIETARWNFNFDGDSSGDQVVDILDGVAKSDSKKERLLGFVAGLGCATMITENIKFGGEWVYTHYRKSSNLTLKSSNNPRGVTATFRPRTSDFRLRLSYKW